MCIAGIIVYASKNPLAALIYLIVTIVVIIFISIFAFLKEYRDYRKVKIQKKIIKNELHIKLK